MHKGEPRILNKIEDDKFYFKHFNRDKKVEEGFVHISTSEIETIIKF